METNVSTEIQLHKEAILKQLEILKRTIPHLEEAVKDSEIETRGIGIGWVQNVQTPLDNIAFNVAQVDALARVRVFK